LRTIRACCPWLDLTTDGGLSQLLDRLNIRWKWARSYIHSPDPDYWAKLLYIDHCLALARANPARYPFFFLDEVSLYRQPSLAPTYAATGHTQPLARRSCRSNTVHRVLGAVDALTGQVIFLQRSHISVPVLTEFYQTVSQRRPDATQIFVAVDNWPVHYHPDLLAVLQPQTFPWPPKLPSNWPSAARDCVARLNLPIQLLSLPTYASWTNPIEKVWRGLKQTVVHLHRHADDLPGLDQRVAGYLNQFAQGGPDLLHAIGLGRSGNLWTGRLRAMQPAA
jgi:hypothetical protein